MPPLAFLSYLMLHYTLQYRIVFIQCLLSWIGAFLCHIRDYSLYFSFPTICLLWKDPSQDDCTAHITFWLQMKYLIVRCHSTPFQTLWHCSGPPIQRPLLEMTPRFLFTDNIWWHADMDIIIVITATMPSWHCDLKADAFNHSTKSYSSSTPHKKSKGPLAKSWAQEGP